MNGMEITRYGFVRMVFISYLLLFPPQTSSADTMQRLSIAFYDDILHETIIRACENNRETEIQNSTKIRNVFTHRQLGSRTQSRDVTFLPCLSLFTHVPIARGTV